VDSAKIINDSEGQAVVLPEGYEFAGDCVYIAKSGRAVLLLPCNSPRDVIAESSGKFSNDFTDESE
jgi:virulence-associated protein VagC